MTRNRKIIQLTGLLLLVGSTVGGGLTYRSMRSETFLHARTGMVHLRPDVGIARAAALFQVYEAGSYRIYLTRYLRGDLARAAMKPIDSTHTTISICVLDAVDDTVKAIEVSPSGYITAEPADSSKWLYVGSFEVVELTDRPWSMHVRMESAASPFEMEIFVLPPQRLDIVSFLQSRTVRLIACGVGLVSGFIIIVLAGRRRQ